MGKRQRLIEEALHAEAERQRVQLEERQAKELASKNRISSAGCAWHEVLGVSPAAYQDEVKKAFRELALMHHPDKSVDYCDLTFRRVQEAYQRGMRMAPAGQQPQHASTSSFKPPDRAS